MTNIILAGAEGRMGHAILSVLSHTKDMHLVAAVEAMGHTHIGKKVYKNIVLTSDLSAALKDADVMIDFTLADSSIINLKTAAAAKKPVVIGTTGHTQDQRAEINALSKVIPIVYSPNMSVGVNVMLKIIAETAALMGADCKIDIVETHHVHKKDAPSGTAKKMLETLQGNEAEVKSIREGEVVGDHTITFATPYETLSISHHAISREVFASGALRAAKWMVGKPAGLYGMDDVLNIKI